MKNLLQFTKTTTMVLIALFGVSYVSAQTSWVGPTAAFPNDTVDRRPMTSGADFQIRKGAIQLGDENNVAGLTVWSGATLLPGDLSVGTSTLATTTGLMALFDGKIGATQYCDETGANCFDSSAAANSGQMYFLSPLTTASGAHATYYSKSGTTWSSTPTPSLFAPSSDISFSLNDLRTNIPQIAAETRNIKGIIVTVAGTVTGAGATASYDYMMSVEGDSYISGTSDDASVASISDDDPFAARVSLNGGTTKATIPMMRIMDIANDGDFEVSSRLDRTTSNVPGGTTLTTYVYVIGYIVE